MLSSKSSVVEGLSIAELWRLRISISFFHGGRCHSDGSGALENKMFTGGTGASRAPNQSLDEIYTRGRPHRRHMRGTIAMIAKTQHYVL